jgi:hypothetical protein
MRGTDLTGADLTGVRNLEAATELAFATFNKTILGPREQRIVKRFLQQSDLFHQQMMES